MYDAAPSAPPLLPPPGRYADLGRGSIIDRRKAVNAMLRYPRVEELRSVVYACGEDRYLVTATTSIWEAGPVARLPWDVADEELGYAVLDSLLQYHAHPPLPRNGGVRTWRALQASGARSRKRFKEISNYVDLRTIGSGIVICAGDLPGGVFVGQLASIAPAPAEIGGLVRKLVGLWRTLAPQATA